MIPKGWSSPCRAGADPQRGAGVGGLSQWAWGRGKDPMRVLQGKRGSGGVSIWGPTGQDRLSTGQDLGGPHGGPTEQERAPLWGRKVSMGSHRARRRSLTEQRGAQGGPQYKEKFPY